MGHVIALNRAAAYISAESAANEYIDGLESYYLIKKLDSEFVGNEGRLEATLKGLRDRIFVRERATLFQAGREDKSFAANLLSILKSGSAAGDFAIAPLGIRNEGISIPARISYAVSVLPAELSGAKPHGSYLVARNLLSYGYLWNKIRVEGGAYGSGLVCRRSGLVGFYSYRDPNAARSLELYGGSSDYLRALANSGEDLTGFIIGAVGESDPLLTPKTTGALGMLLALRGESHCDRVKKREQMLSTDKTALIATADLIDDVCREGAFCIIGGKEKLEGAKSKLKEIGEL
jgi:Zn-dependent M16 (insulinase) family peptidase